MQTPLAANLLFLPINRNLILPWAAVGQLKTPIPLDSMQLGRGVGRKHRIKVLANKMKAKVSYMALPRKWRLFWLRSCWVNRQGPFTFHLSSWQAWRLCSHLVTRKTKVTDQGLCSRKEGSLHSCTSYELTSPGFLVTWNKRSLLSA